ncbi:MAG: TIM barrel protein [Candidatus Omnitrophota bacterium]
MRLGLKLWSTNLNYILPARELFARKVFDYVELFVVPGSLGLLPQWQGLPFPYVLHAPHSYAGLNPADPLRRQENLALTGEVDAYTSALSPDWVIFHPGVSGEAAESIAQFRALAARFPDMFRKALLENKPQIGMKGETCLGASPDELRAIKDGADLRFCLDFGHAICYAVAAGKPWKKVLTDFLACEPAMFHLSDGFFTVKDAHEHFGSGEYDLPFLAGCIPTDGWVSIETKKDSADDLDDFAVDAEKLRGYARISS